MHLDPDDRLVTFEMALTLLLAGRRRRRGGRADDRRHPGASSDARTTRYRPYIATTSQPIDPTTEPATRQVAGHPDIYAPGDAGDFPVKQAFLAFLEADAVAEDIVAQVRGKEPRVRFDPVSMCVMEQLDKATFAQVPLALTGDPARPVIVRPGADELYKVGVSPLWRIGKKLLGVYLPMRFRAGEPFHAGAAWKMMDVGLLAMSGALAD